MDKKLTRSKDNRVISGVCGGIAKTYGLDATLIRIGMVVICFITAFIPVTLIYGVMWFITPEEE